MHRTIILKLDTTLSHDKILGQTLQNFTIAFNFVCQFGWSNSKKNSVELHKATYRKVQDLVKLPSQLICAARIKAAETLTAAFSHKQAGRKVSQPHSRLCPIRYDQRSYGINWKDTQVSLATVQGRLRIPFKIPPYVIRYISYPLDSADLIYRKGRFWLHVVITLPDVEFHDTQHSIGIDLGINQPAVTSQRQFLGSRHWKEVDRRNFRLMRALQSKGTKSAKRHLRKLSGRQQRFRKDCDHVLSKRIVQSVSAGTTIVIEDLTKIRIYTRLKKGVVQRRIHSWSFAQLRSFLSYKAEEAGMKVVAIDPRYTSQVCSHCGYRDRANRKTQSLFICKLCAYSLNADLNAAYNIRYKHLASLGISLAGGPQSIGLLYPTTS